MHKTYKIKKHYPVKVTALSVPLGTRVLDNKAFFIVNDKSSNNEESSNISEKSNSKNDMSQSNYTNRDS